MKDLVSLNDRFCVSATFGEKWTERRRSDFKCFRNVSIYYKESYNGINIFFQKTRKQLDDYEIWLDAAKKEKNHEHAVVWRFCQLDNKPRDT